ncbi:hypothetical protein SAMN04487938_3168 [Lysobacter sp. cf310]|nr:hypothetical protein SAMN04487938_3168 [Lysobacter sp. cf310]
MCLAIALPLLPSCSHPGPPAKSGAASAITVTRVDRAVFDAASGKDPTLKPRCEAWTLNDKQVANYFAAAREYPDGTHDAYYWLPCSIKGRLRAGGQDWEFEINAAATATWTRGDSVRKWGCDAKACEPLVLMMPDGNNP